jgi:uncharacterized membrane protein required for colicin V production
MAATGLCGDDELVEEKVFSSSSSSPVPTTKVIQQISTCMLTLSNAKLRNQMGESSENKHTHTHTHTNTQTRQ